MLFFKRSYFQKLFKTAVANKHQHIPPHNPAAFFVLFTMKMNEDAEDCLIGFHGMKIYQKDKPPGCIKEEVIEDVEWQLMRNAFSTIFNNNHSAWPETPVCDGRTRTRTSGQRGRIGQGRQTPVLSANGG